MIPISCQNVLSAFLGTMLGPFVSEIFRCQDQMIEIWGGEQELHMQLDGCSPKLQSILC